MSCCTPTAAAVAEAQARTVENNDQALMSLSRRLADGSRQLEFVVPDAHCAACIRAIEDGLAALPLVLTARVNLTKRRVRVVFDPAIGTPAELSAAIRAAGYHNSVSDPAAEGTGDPVLGELITSLGVAGFAAGNIMLFSVSVWAGADAATRDLFHWLSAIIALPAILFAGRVFFRSAWRALRVGRTNMDVPISIGVILATGLSLYETVVSGEHAYFDASTTLLFFLLAGRTLDHLMRERARNAITVLARSAPRGGTRVMDDGRREYVALDEIEPGMTLELQAGERVPVDGTVLSAGAVFDYAIVTGESAPHAIGVGEAVMAGASNAGAVALVRAHKRAPDSFLARMAALMEAAESAKTRRQRLVEKAAAVYAPVVHALALAAFIGWGLTSGDWHAALLNAVAVLIITCPCALALAVPVTHVIAAGRLFEHGILMKDGAALERAAEADSVAFDKTGTLTEGQPRLVETDVADETARRAVGALAAKSTHPLSRALAAVLPSGGEAREVVETAGQGIEGRVETSVWRLGNAAWCGVGETAAMPGTRVWVARDGQAVGSFGFADTLREDAAEAIARLEAMGLPVRLLSGDAPQPVASVAAAVGIATARAGLLPQDKVTDVGRDRTMMVGDGINDAPAMRAAHVSMAPASAADIGRSAADFVYTAGRLSAVPMVIDIARRATRIANQNLAIAIAYNALAVPIAISGHATPLIAALAMSSSSVIVVANATRLRFAGRGGARRQRAPATLPESAAPATAGG